MRHSWRVFFIPLFLVTNAINGQYVESQANLINPQYYGSSYGSSTELGPQLMNTLLTIARDNGIISDILPVLTTPQSPLQYNIKQDIYGTSGGNIVAERPSQVSIASSSSASTAQSGSPGAPQTSNVATSTASSSVSSNSQAATVSQTTTRENNQSPLSPFISQSANNLLPEIPVMYPSKTTCSRPTPYQSTQNPCQFAPPQYVSTPMPPPMPPIIIDGGSSGNNCGGSNKILPLLFLSLLSNNRGCGNSGCNGSGGGGCGTSRCDGSGGCNNCCCMPLPYPYPPPFIYPFNGAPVQVDPLVTPTVCR